MPINIYQCTNPGFNCFKVSLEPADTPDAFQYQTRTRITSLEPLFSNINGNIVIVRGATSKIGSVGNSRQIMHEAMHFYSFFVDMNIVPPCSIPWVSLFQGTQPIRWKWVWSSRRYVEDLVPSPWSDLMPVTWAENPAIVPANVPNISKYVLFQLIFAKPGSIWFFITFDLKTCINKQMLTRFIM